MPKIHLIPVALFAQYMSQLSGDVYFEDYDEEFLERAIEELSPGVYSPKDPVLLFDLNEKFGIAEMRWQGSGPDPRGGEKVRLVDDFARWHESLNYVVAIVQIPKERFTDVDRFLIERGCRVITRGE